jgi:hypothetical protein
MELSSVCSAKTQQLAFGHDLLYAWVDALSSHRSVTFHSFWFRRSRPTKGEHGFLVHSHV